MLRIAVQGHRQLDSAATFEHLVALALCWANRANATASVAPQKTEDCDSSQIQEALRKHNSNDNADSQSIAAFNDGLVDAEFSQILLNMFWSECFTQCDSFLYPFDCTILTRLRKFILIIRNPKLHSHSKKSGVKFRSEKSDPKTALRSSLTQSSANHNSLCPVSFEVQFAGSTDAIKNLAVHCHELYCNSRNAPSEEQRQLEYMRVLCLLLEVFSPFHLYRAIVPGELCEDECCVAFMQRVLVPELKHPDYALAVQLVKCWQQLLLMLDQQQQTDILADTLVSSSANRTVR